MDNFGSFGAPAGGISPELQEAMGRRGPQGGATSAVTQGAPTFDPASQPPQPPQGGVPPMGGQPQQATPTSPFDQSELKQIVGALTGRLKLLGGIQQAAAGIPPKGS